MNDHIAELFAKQGDEDTVKNHWEIVCQARDEVTGKFSAELFAKQRRTGNRKIQQ